MRNLFITYFIIIVAYAFFGPAYAAHIVLQDGTTGNIKEGDTSGTQICYKKGNNVRRIDKNKVKFIIIGCDTIDYTVPISPVIRMCSGPTKTSHVKNGLLHTFVKWPLQNDTTGHDSLLIYDKPFLKNARIPLFDTLNNYLLEKTRSKLISSGQLRNHLKSRDDVAIVLAVDYYFRRNTLKTFNEYNSESKRATYCAKIHYIIINPHKKIRILDEELTEDGNIPFGRLGALYAKANDDEIRKKSMFKIVTKMTNKIYKLQSIK